MTKRKTYPRAVKYGLIAGLFMIFVQVVVGGVTRLTGSGLSITRWEIVTGTLPPLNAAQWEEAFALYKQTPQYQKINQGMRMEQFKFIYFWEYVHRLWARLMGFVFLLPLAVFCIRGWLDRRLLAGLGVVFWLAGLAASFGWIMVASGLVDRPWVNAYKLTLHLGIALSLFAYLLWTILLVAYPQRRGHYPRLRRTLGFFTALLVVQLALGGLMSGMKAGLFYPSWPDMNGELLPAAVLDPAEWRVENLVDYDRGGFAVALVQVLHRTVAYALLLWGVWLALRLFGRLREPLLRRASGLWVSLLGVQVLLGIITVINSRGQIPVDYGVYHQAGALLLLGTTLFLLYHLGGTSAATSSKREVSSGQEAVVEA